MFDSVTLRLIAEIRDAEVPVLVLTTTQDPAWWTRALAVGADKVLTTTSSSDEIIDAMLRLSGA